MKQINKRGSRNKIGGVGEEIAKGYLLRKNYEYITANYSKKWGEIDLIMRCGGRVHFIEVKTVSYESKSVLINAVKIGSWRPEENVHQQKLKRFSRTIESWLQENDYQGEWQIDVIAVRMVLNERYASVKYIDNVIYDS